MGIASSQEKKLNKEYSHLYVVDMENSAKVLEYRLESLKNFKLKTIGKKVAEKLDCQSVDVDWRDNESIRHFLLSYPETTNLYID